MSIPECATCKNLLLQAGRAIVANLKAVSRLEEAVIQTPCGDMGVLQTRVSETGIARENAVRAYEDHLTAHRASLRVAGS